MKQDLGLYILCPDCALRVRDSYPNDNPYPGEYLKFVEGDAKRDFICDHCDQPIPIHGMCFAFSVWTDRFPYFDWEDGYIKKRGLE
jgi:hypothetical protein